MKKRIVFLVCAALCALLIIFSHEAADAARNGFRLWQNSLLPALLPFFVCSRIMLRCGALDPADPVALFTLSFISGAPSGAKLCGMLEGHGGARCPWALTAAAASLNTLSPVFVCSAFASSMLGFPAAAAPLVAAQLISSLIAFALCMRLLPLRMQMNTQAPSHAGEKNAADSSAGKLFIEALTDAVSSLLSICGAVVFFCVLAALLKSTGLLFVLTWPARALITALGGQGEGVYPITLSLLEAASGAGALAEAYSAGVLSSRAAVTAAAFAFSFGGICVAVQSMLFMRIDLGRYVLLKLAQGAAAAIIAYSLYPLVAGASLRASSSLDETLANAASAGVMFACALFAMGIMMLLITIRRNRAVRQKQKADASR